MKAKVARKAVRHAKPMRKSTRGKKRARAKATANKKEMFRNVAAESEMTTATFEAPVEFVELEMEPAVEVIEVFEVEGSGDEEEE